MTVKLVETAVTPAESGGKWLIQLISEGVGSSGMYPADVLERDGATAFPRGTQVFMDHLTDSEDWDRNGNHSIKDLVGATLEDATFDAETKSLRAPVKWFNGYESFINEAKDFIGLSVEASGILADGVVESLIYSPHNAVAVVPRAGRDGKVLHALTESYRGTIIPDGINTSEEPGKGHEVTPEDIKQIVEGIVAGLSPLLVKEEVAPETTEDAVDRAEVVEAAVEAGLGKTARTRVLTAVAAGAKIEEAIAAEKALRDEILKEASVENEAPVGRIKLAEGATDDFTVGGWN